MCQKLRIWLIVNAMLLWCIILNIHHTRWSDFFFLSFRHSKFEDVISMTVDLFLTQLALFLTTTNIFFTSTVLLVCLVVLPAWPLSPAMKEEGMGNLEPNLMSLSPAKLQDLAGVTAWGWWLSLCPGIGFCLCCRWNSSVSSSEFRWG